MLSEKQSCTEDDLYFYCRCMCNLAMALNRDRSLTSPVDLEWTHGKQTSKCYWFEVLWCCKRYIKLAISIIDASIQSKEYVDRFVAGFASAPNENKEGKVVTETHLVASRALGLAWFLQNEVMKRYTAASEEILDAKEIHDLYHNTRARALPFALVHTDIDIRWMVSIAWSLHTYVPARSARYRTIAIMAAVAAYYKIGEWKDALGVFDSLPVGTYQVIPPSIATMRSVVTGKTTKSLDELLVRWTEKQYMVQGTPVDAGSFFT